MFFTKKPKFESIHEAEGRFNRSGLLSNPNSLRKKIKILAIDDAKFDPETNLTNSGFKIKTISDIQKISDVEPYEIILCDVNGIGVNLSPETQGAYVIDEIKKAYPEKTVVAYTAGSALSKLVTVAKQRADFDIRKDASIEDWRDLLDGIILSICNPISVWKRERVRLLSSGMELHELVEIEQALLTNLGKGSKTIKSAIEASAKETGGNETSWGKEIGEFLASKAFDLAFDYLLK